MPLGLHPTGLNCSPYGIDRRKESKLHFNSYLLSMRSKALMQFRFLLRFFLSLAKLCSYVCVVTFRLFMWFPIIVLCRFLQNDINSRAAAEAEHAWQRSIMKIGINCYASDGVYSVIFYISLSHSLSCYLSARCAYSTRTHMTQSELPEI